MQVLGLEKKKLTQGMVTTGVPGPRRVYFVPVFFSSCFWSSFLGPCGGRKAVFSPRAWSTLRVIALFPFHVCMYIRQGRERPKCG